ncbi:hypothetical protein JW960_05430 [candidate division KSB1 bacterium]|nr:hypothetical protein [candidate division KSB1 bacterium]
MKTKRRVKISGKRLLSFILFVLNLLYHPAINIAQTQNPFYYHTIHTHGISVLGGRTFKMNYIYQMNHNSQFKLSGTYIYDNYDQNRDRISADIFNLTFQMQYNLIHKKKLFLNPVIGVGGYYLRAKDLLNINNKEWKFSFVTGLQAEYYVVRNVLAVTIEYDFLYMPWSNIYNFMHIPTLGVTVILF